MQLLVCAAFMIDFNISTKKRHAFEALAALIERIVHLPPSTSWSR